MAFYSEADDLVLLLERTTHLLLLRNTNRENATSLRRGYLVSYLFLA